MLLFKRHAPNDMKKGDLIAKWWIITDREPGLTPTSPETREAGAFFQRPRSGMTIMKMHESFLILYSQNIYGS
jgi:hypothetical protein